MKKKEPLLESIRLDRKNLRVLEKTPWANQLLQMILSDEAMLSEEEQKESKLYIVA